MVLAATEPTLDASEEDARRIAHRFARDVLRPIGAELDRMPDPEEVISVDSPLWQAFACYRALRLDELDDGVAPSDGGWGREALLAHARARFLVSEELGWGDAGLAISLGVSSFPRMFALLSGRPALIERFAGSGTDDIGCWAITEPDHGSDSLLFTEPHFADPAVRPGCIARRDGDHYVINGQKSAWVSNGTIADVAALFCTLDPGQGFRGGGVCLVPLDLPGVSRGKPLDKLGQRALNQGEIFFDDVRIPAEYVVLGPEGYAGVVEMVLTFANASMGAIFVGLARAALEHALAYAKERVQGGRPIFEHQSVKSRLFKIFTQVEAARSLAWSVMCRNAAGTPRLELSIASKVFCTNTAFEAASAALQIFGGNGLSRDYPIEKLLRDARASMIEDGCNEALGLIGASRL
jgi:alkylation response protein AidB-like acyl-CoA dehydrogenase